MLSCIQVTGIDDKKGYTLQRNNDNESELALSTMGEYWSSRRNREMYSLVLHHADTLSTALIRVMQCLLFQISDTQ